MFSILILTINLEVNNFEPLPTAFSRRLRVTVAVSVLDASHQPFGARRTSPPKRMYEYPGFAMNRCIDGNYRIK